MTTFIRPKDLPPAASVTETAAIPVDSGTAVEKATPAQVVNAGRPIATESQAIAGANNTVAMTPLTTRQAINSDTSGSVAKAEAAAERAEEAAESVLGPFASRSEFVTWAGSNTADDGVIASDGTVQYVATSGATAIPDLLGWLPFGEMTSKHVGGIAQSKIDAMYDYQGYVVINGAETASATVLVLDRITFEDGAYVSVNSGVTFEIQGSIESGKQHIFRGDGDISLNHDNGGDRSGEESREVHASWFGVFPSGDKTRDEGPAIEKASSSFGNTREGVIKFDVGNYQVNSQIDLSRGTLIEGTNGYGDRRTVFKTNTDGFTMFKTLNDACAWRGIQFEKHSTLASRSSPWVEINHAGCVIDYANMGESGSGVLVNTGGIGTRITNIGATYGADPGSATDLIDVRAPTCVIENVFIPSSNFGPESIVRIGASSNISDISVRNLRWQSEAVGVDIFATSGNVTGVNIFDVRHHQFAESASPALVRITTLNSFDCERVNIVGVNSNGYATRALDLNQSSTGAMSDILLDDVIMSGTGDIVRVSRSSGTLSRVSVGSWLSENRTLFNESGVSAGELMQIVRQSGETVYINGVPLAPMVVTIDDDSVANIATPNRGGKATVITNASETFPNVAASGILLYDVGTSPTSLIVAEGANFDVVGTALTGTSGVDGAVTVGTGGGLNILQVENRTGATADFTIILEG